MAEAVLSEPLRLCRDGAAYAGLFALTVCSCATRTLLLHTDKLKDP